MNPVQPGPGVQPGPSGPNPSAPAGGTGPSGPTRAPGFAPHAHTPLQQAVPVHPTGQTVHGDYAAAFQAGAAPAGAVPGTPGPPPAAQQGAHAAPQPDAPPQRKRRAIPAWMALSGMLVIALIAGGAGGVAGAFLGGADGAQGAAEEEGPVMNEPPPEAPQRDPDTVAGVAQRVGPSVVSITSADPRSQGGGSGFVIEGDYVVTNDHVSSELEGDGIVVEYSDGSLSEASVVGADPSSDLAVLSLEEPNDVEPLQFGDSEQVIVGDEVIAIGAPLGLSGTVTQGIVSAVNRPVSSGEGEEASRFYALQTDAAINPGNSGGPLVDLQGRVIGVNSMIYTMGGAMGEPSGNIGLGFAIPSVEVERVVNRLIEYGETEYAELGVEIDLDSSVEGAVVADGADAVQSGGPADEAGLEPGDVIVSLDGSPVESGQELLAMLRGLSPGDEVELGYERDGGSETTMITLGSSED